MLEEKLVRLQIDPSLVSAHYLYGTLAFPVCAAVTISEMLSQFQFFDDSSLKILRFNIKCPVFTILLVCVFSIAFDAFINLIIRLAGPA